MKLSIIILLLLMPVVFADNELADPGILPDSPLYVIDQFFERVGDDPEKAFAYQEEKIAEAHAMAEQKKAEYVEVALNNAEEYGAILEKEVTPAMEETIEDKADAIETALEEIAEDVPELDDDIDKHLEQLKRTELAAKVSGRIKKLCETLSELDAVEYANTCKAGEDSPQWQHELDEKLTDEQKEHAKTFVKKMKQCMKSSGKECDCEGMGVQSFTALCKEKSSQAAACADGEQEACRSMNSDGVDFKNYLPPYLIEAMSELRDEFEGDDEFDEDKQQKYPLPPPCQEAGITSPNECMKLMKEKGEDFTEYKQKFEMDNSKVKFEEKYRGQPPRIQEFGRDCHAVKELSEKVRCFEEFYNSAHGSFDEKFERKYEYGEYKPAMHDDWTSSYAQRWFAAQNDDEREQLKKEMQAEMEKRGINPEHAKTDFDDDEFEFEYEDESGVEYKNEYAVNENWRYGNPYKEGQEVPMSDDEQKKIEEYQKQYESGQYEQTMPSPETYEEHSGETSSEPSSYESGDSNSGTGSGTDGTSGSDGGSTGESQTTTG